MKHEIPSGICVSEFDEGSRMRSEITRTGISECGCVGGPSTGTRRMKRYKKEAARNRGTNDGTLTSLLMDGRARERRITREKGENWCV